MRAGVPPEGLWKFWTRRHDSDILVGIRANRADGAFRRAVSGIMRTVNLLVWQTWIPDANCPFKLMRRDVLETVLPVIPATSFIPMVALCIVASRAGFRLRSIPVQHFPRRAGQQSLAGLWRWANVGPRCAMELLRLRVDTRLRHLQVGAATRARTSSL